MDLWTSQINGLSRHADYLTSHSRMSDVQREAARVKELISEFLTERRTVKQISEHTGFDGAKVYRTLKNMNVNRIRVRCRSGIQFEYERAQ